MEFGVFVYIWLKDGKLDEIYDNFIKVKNLYMIVYKKEDILDEYYWKYNCCIFFIFINFEVGWVIE